MAEGTMTTKRITRDDLAETITDALLLVDGQDITQATQRDFEVLVSLLRCSLVFLANDEFDWLEVQVTK
jgi:hypothetical protein